MKRLRFGLDSLKLPTPKQWRRLGNALLTVTSSASVGGYLDGHTKLATGLFLVGLVSRFLVEFFSEETTQHSPADTDSSNPSTEV